MAKRVCLLVLCLLAAFSVAPSFAALTHAFAWRSGVGMVDLGVLAGYTSSCARAISDQGVVVGYSYGDEGGTRAFAWTQSGGMVDLGTLPGGQLSAAYGVNSLGQIVGFSSNERGESRAVLWNPNGSIVDLGTLMPSRTGNSVAFAINNDGLVVGTADAPRDFGMTRSQAFSWTQSAGIHNLGRASATDVSSSARAVNNDGLIVGRSTANSDWSSAYAITSTGWTEIGSGIALGVNNSGTVVGNDGFGRGFVWTSLTGPAGLDTLPGDTLCQANGINSFGQIVGASIDANGSADAVIWQQNGTTTDLGALLGASYRSVAYGINSQGDVVGDMTVPGLPGVVTLSLGVCLLALRLEVRRIARGR